MAKKRLKTQKIMNKPGFWEQFGRGNQTKGPHSALSLGRDINKEYSHKIGYASSEKDVVTEAPYYVDAKGNKVDITQFGFNKNVTAKKIVGTNKKGEKSTFIRVVPEGKSKATNRYNKNFAFKKSANNVELVDALNRNAWKPVHHTRPERFALIKKTNGQYTLHKTQSYVDMVDLSQKNQVTVRFDEHPYGGLRDYTFGGSGVKTFSNNLMKGLALEKMPGGQAFSLGTYVQTNVGPDYNAKKIMVGKRETMQPLNKNLKITKIRG